MQSLQRFLAAAAELGESTDSITLLGEAAGAENDNENDMNLISVLASITKSTLIKDLHAAAVFEQQPQPRATIATISTVATEEVSVHRQLPPIKNMTSGNVKATMSRTILEEKRKKNQELKEAQRLARELAKRSEQVRTMEAVDEHRTRERDGKSVTRHRLALEWSASFDGYRDHRHEVRDIREKREAAKLNIKKEEYFRKQISKFMDFERNGRSGITSESLSAHTKLNQKIINSQRDILQLMREKRRCGLYKQRRKKNIMEKSEESNMRMMREEDRSSRLREKAGENLRCEMQKLEVGEHEQRIRIATSWNREMMNLKATLEREHSVIRYEDSTKLESSRTAGRSKFLKESYTLFEKVHNRSVINLLEKLERETASAPPPRPGTTPELSWYEKEETRLMSDLCQFYSPMKEVSMLSIRKNRMLQSIH
eukprot:TRINITY_DN11000_c0_g1_i1.p1 TRINITY_DN11000_c0_g1~~TRINITY_DN11000_c0_g1_i1.p1  ORF type:complete len:428 (+),score=96.68 TRINITY_DN11000_c0_g1_i1:430-1713(+)